MCQPTSKRKIGFATSSESSVNSRRQHIAQSTVAQWFASQQHINVVYTRRNNTYCTLSANMQTSQQF
jgi:hypothetical protein